MPTVKKHESKKIPTWNLCSKKSDLIFSDDRCGSLSPMELFIYEFEPVENNTAFRKDLQELADKYNLYF